MLHALYERYCNHVAWLWKDQYLFDTEMNWLAFIDNKQVWSKEALKWLGPLNGIRAIFLIIENLKSCLDLLKNQPPSYAQFSKTHLFLALHFLDGRT
jgi:hypothetical protein